MLTKINRLSLFLVVIFCNSAVSMNRDEYESLFAFLQTPTEIPHEKIEPQPSEIFGITTPTIEPEKLLMNKKFPCHVCSEKLSTMHSLKYHLMRKHQDEKPFACNRCQKTYALLADLNAHQKKHLQPTKMIPYRAINESTNFPCLDPQCPSVFASKARLSKHYEGIHQAISAFACTYCTASYAMPSHFQQHLKHHAALDKPRIVSHDPIDSDQS